MGSTTFFTITHPFHPLNGRRFELVSYGHCWGEERVSFHNDEGHLCSIPVSWTSMATPDPFVAVAQGRSLFRIEDLLALVALVRELSGMAGESKPGA